MNRETYNEQNFKQLEGDWLTPPEEKEDMYDEEVHAYLMRVKREHIKTVSNIGE